MKINRNTLRAKSISSCQAMIACYIYNKLAKFFSPHLEGVYSPSRQPSWIRNVQKSLCHYVIITNFYIKFEQIVSAVFQTTARDTNIFKLISIWNWITDLQCHPAQSPVSGTKCLHASQKDIPSWSTPALWVPDWLLKLNEM